MLDAEPIEFVLPLKPPRSKKVTPSLMKLTDATRRLEFAANEIFVKNQTPYAAAKEFLRTMNDILNTLLLENNRFDSKMAELSIDVGVNTHGRSDLEGAKAEMIRAVTSWVDRREYASERLHIPYVVRSAIEL